MRWSGSGRRDIREPKSRFADIRPCRVKATGAERGARPPSTFRCTSYLSRNDATNVEESLVVSLTW